MFTSVLPYQHRVSLFIRLSLAVSILIALVKFFAWYKTGSLVILSDALESLINVTGACFAWYSIWLSGKPRDTEHPYGHGKVEFFSIGFEGALILIAGAGIIWKAVQLLLHPQPVESPALGLWLTAGTGLANLLLGWVLLRQGKQLHSVTLEGNGRHIMSDSFSSLGVIVAMALILMSGKSWIDPVASLVAGAIIVITGVRLVRKSVSGLMDEAEPEVVNTIIRILQEHREPAWIDVHNLRVQRFGSFYHVDAHVTLPHYYSLQQVHEQLTRIDEVLNTRFDRGSIEFFIHTDPCIPDSCPHCTLQQCPVRQQPFQAQLTWSRHNLLPNRKHRLKEGVPFPE
ncbi:MAG TPA: cation diffusion facilitator family transporter [Lacibacter sp.]|nr:cation diffusion facilitator family transporter [Lacibacter sp.]HMO89663.1 cation diffusion facilitator family transporter [Lacibacter sp.]HMP87153.1 cation diffusion facilitator family transporter [Lacibacter sp.]